MNSLPMLPTIIMDMVGSVIIIFLSFLSLLYAYRLIRRQPENFLWASFFTSVSLWSVFQFPVQLGIFSNKY